MDGLRHLRIERAHELILHLDDRDSKTAAQKLLGAFDADVAAAEDQRPAAVNVFDPLGDCVDVGDGPAKKDIRAFDTRNGRYDR